MVDTVKLWVPPERLNHLDLLAELPVILDRVTIHQPVEDNGEFSISGRLKNIKVSASHSGLRIHGSLSKYYMGENIGHLERRDIYNAVAQLSSELRVNLHYAKIYRLHFGLTLKMTVKPKAYFNHLISCIYYSRSLMKDSLYFSNNNRLIVFYDKLRELGADRDQIPASFRGNQLLRIECRLEKAPGTYLEYDKMEARDLYSHSGYLKMVRYCEHEYERIQKVGKMNYDTERIEKPKDVIDLLISRGIQNIGGPEKVYEMIEELKNRGSFAQPEYPSRARKIVRKHLTTSHHPKGNDLIEELNSRFKAQIEAIGQKSYLP